MHEYTIKKGGVIVDHVFYNAPKSAEEVKKDLVGRDGYHSSIEVHCPHDVDREGFGLWTKDPDKPGYLKRLRNITPREAASMLEDKLKEEGLTYEYLSSCERYNKEEEMPNRGSVACYAVTGGSEGHYVHVDYLYEGSRVFHVISVKILSEDMSYARKIAAIAGDLFHA